MALLDNISDEIFKEFIRLKMTYDAMGKLLGVSQATVYKEINKRGLIKSSRKLEEVSNEELIKYRNEDKLTYGEIGKIFNVSANTVSNEYKTRGIDLKANRITSRILENISDKELINYRLDGLSYNDIADKLCVSKSLIIKEFKLRKIEDELYNRKSKLINIDNDLLERLRNSNKTYEDIAELLDVSVVTIHKEYKERGLKE